jgi:hypothetical protein
VLEALTVEENAIEKGLAFRGEFVGSWCDMATEYSAEVKYYIKFGKDRESFGVRSGRCARLVSSDPRWFGTDVIKRAKRHLREGRAEITHFRQQDRTNKMMIPRLCLTGHSLRKLAGNKCV